MGASCYANWIKSENVGKHDWENVELSYAELEENLPDDLVKNDVPNFDGLEFILDFVARDCADEKILKKDEDDLIIRMDFDLVRLMIARAIVFWNNLIAIETEREFKESPFRFQEFEEYTIENDTVKLCYLVNRLKAVKDMMRRYKEYELIVEVEW